MATYGMARRLTWVAALAALSCAVRAHPAAGQTPPSPDLCQSIPGSVTLQPQGLATFCGQQLGRIPPPELYIDNTSGQIVTVSYATESYGTLSVSTSPGVALLVGTPDDSDAVCQAGSGQEVSVTCTSVQPSGPPLEHFVTIFTFPAGGQATVMYPAGWNLVGGPAGTRESDALGSLYAFGAGDTAYRPAPASSALEAGTGYWAYFPQPTTVTLGPAQSGGTMQLPLAAGQYTLVANPFPTPALLSTDKPTIVYDPRAGYSDAPLTPYYPPRVMLKPGQGAWVYSAFNTSAPISPAPD